MSTQKHPTLDETIQQLEADLARATERSRAAKLAVKQAKGNAKWAKKERKRVRRALIDAQEAAGTQTLEQPTEAMATKSAAKGKKGTRAERGKIADTPERRRDPRKPRRRVTRPASPALAGSSLTERAEDLPAEAIPGEKSTEPAT